MGPYHTAVINESGDLYSFGLNKYGALGNGRESNEYEPVRLDLNQVADVACGEHHTVALTKDGSVWTWGYGGNVWTKSVGALGNGEHSHVNTPTRVEDVP